MFCTINLSTNSVAIFLSPLVVFFFFVHLLYIHSKKGVLFSQRVSASKRSFQETEVVVPPTLFGSHEIFLYKISQLCFSDRLINPFGHKEILRFVRSIIYNTYALTYFLKKNIVDAQRIFSMNSRYVSAP